MNPIALFFLCMTVAVILAVICQAGHERWTRKDEP